MADSTNGHYGYLDALRGLAILGVLLVHSSQEVNPGYTLRLISGKGALGVQLFFIVSAITLFLSLEAKSKKEKKPVLNFFIRRFFRIAPMFYAGIILYTLLNGLGPRYFAPNGIKWWFFPMTFTFLHGWHPETINSVVPGGWSIAVEFSFYLIVPFVFTRLKDIRSSLIFILASLLLRSVLSAWVTPAVAAFYPQTDYLAGIFTSAWFFSQLPVFGLGILVYHILKKLPAGKNNLLGWTLFLFSIFLCVAYLDNASYHDLMPEHVIYAGIFGLLVISLRLGSISIVDNAVTQWLGKISFSMYITHFAVILLLQTLFKDGFPLAGNLGLVIFFLLVVLISTAISSITYTFVEKQGIRLGKKVIHKWENPKQSICIQPADRPA